MKLHFEPNLDYQLEAIEAVCDLFRGQEQGCSELSVRTQSKSAQFTLGIGDADLGVGNQLLLSGEALLANLQDIQLRCHLPQVLTEPLTLFRSQDRCWFVKDQNSSPPRQCAQNLDTLFLAHRQGAYKSG